MQITFTEDEMRGVLQHWVDRHLLSVGSPKVASWGLTIDGGVVATLVDPEGEE